MKNELVVLLSELIEKNKVSKDYILSTPEFQPFLNQQEIKDKIVTPHLFNLQNAKK
jgi:hypothetical protein